MLKNFYGVIIIVVCLFKLFIIVVAQYKKSENIIKCFYLYRDEIIFKIEKINLLKRNLAY